MVAVSLAGLTPAQLPVTFVRALRAFRLVRIFGKVAPAHTRPPAPRRPQQR